MLVPAILYKDEICKKFMEYAYTDDMMYYNGCLESATPSINDVSDASHYQYAIVDNDKLIGYFTFNIGWYNSCISCFGLFAFDRNNKIIGLDVCSELKKVIKDYHIHRMEWRMVGGNPVEKHYDRFCKRYNGNKFVLTDAIKDRHGNYHNDVIYEILFRGKRDDTGEWIKGDLRQDKDLV